MVFIDHLQHLYKYLATGYTELKFYPLIIAGVQLFRILSLL